MTRHNLEITLGTERYWVDRDEPSSGWRRLFPYSARKNASVFCVGGGWGNAINWTDTKALRVVGWKNPKPRAGDWLLSPMQSGSVGGYIFSKVEPCPDPHDMFFATVIKVGYARPIP